MMYQLLFILFLTIITLITISIIIYKSNVNFIYKLVTLPLLILLFLNIAVYTYENMGRPLNKFPDSEFDLYHFEIVNGGENVIIWVDDDGSRLYKIPYNREQVKKLKEAMEKKNQQEGIRVKGKFKTNDKNGSNSFEYETTFKEEGYNAVK